jgi:hypothetical protein
MDDAVRSHRSAAQTVKIIEGTTMHLCASGGKRGSGCIRACQAEDLVPCLNQLADDGGADKTCRASHKNSHKKFLQ